MTGLENKMNVWDDKQKSSLLISLLTVALFFSGPFIFLTPLPYIYHQLKFKDMPFPVLVWPSVVVVLCVYAFGLDAFYHLYQKHPNASLLLPIPFLEFIEHFSYVTVLALGAGAFLVCLVTSFMIKKALLVKNNEDVFKVLFLAVFFVFLCSLVLAVLVVLPQINPFKEALLEGFREFIEIRESSGAMSVSQLIDFKSRIHDYADKSIYFIPFALMLGVTFLFVFNTIIAKRFFTPLFNELKSINLTHFVLPKQLVWAVFGILGFLMVNELIFKGYFNFYLLLNLLLIIGIAYLLQGVAVFIATLDNKKVKGIVRIIIIVLVIINHEFSLYALTAIGFADHWLNLRKINKIKSP